MDQPELYETCTHRIGGTEKRIGGKTQYVPDYCPYCGKDNERDFHSSFGQIFPDSGWGFKCFVCGETASIWSLAKYLGVDTGSTFERKITVRKPVQKVDPYWFSQRRNVLNFVTHQPDRYEAWYGYKRLSEHIVDEYQLGTGVLVGTRFKDRRLITPFLENDDPVWFRGRSDSQGWIGSVGVSPRDIALPLVNKVPENAEMVLMTENYVDGILVNEHTPYAAVSVLGVSYWFPHWQEQLIAKRPKLVVVAFDADLAGGLYTPEGIREAAIKRTAAWAKIMHVDGDISIRHVNEAGDGWQMKMQVGTAEHTVKILAPYGIKRANQLRRVGIDAVLFPWSKDDRGKDIGSLFLDWFNSKEAQ